MFIGNHNSRLYAFTASGGLSWSHYATNSAHFSSPAIGTDGNVYVGDNGDGDTFGHLRAFDPSGVFLWSYRAQAQVYASPAIGGDGMIYVGSYDNRFYALAPSGALSWSYDIGEGISSSAALGSDDTVCTAAWDGKVYSFLSSGTLLWTFATGYDIDSSPAIGSDGMIYIGSNDNRVYCLREEPTPTITPTPTSTPTRTATPVPPEPTATPPIDLTADKTEYGTTGAISVTADVWPLSVPCYPFVRIVMADGSTLYYQSGVGFTASPVPYLGFEAGTILTAEPIRDYLALSANFSGIATGTYYLEGGAVDMTRTVSANNLVYWGTVDREELTVR